MIVLTKGESEKEYVRSNITRSVAVMAKRMEMPAPPIWQESLLGLKENVLKKRPPKLTVSN